MAYRRGGIFRSRFIAPVAQRATQVLSKPLVEQVLLQYSSSSGNNGGTYANNVVPPFSVLTTPSAVGQERLLIVGATHTSGLLSDFDGVTIDGQPAVQVGVTSRSTGTERRTFIQVFRAPGTSNTSVAIGLTCNCPSGGNISLITASLFKLSYAGNMAAQVTSTADDPVLSLNVPAKGAIVGGIMVNSQSGFFTSWPDAYTWSGLTERYELHGTVNVAFSSASDEASSAESPRAISVAMGPPGNTTTVCKSSMAISFSPIAVSSVPANSGAYQIVGSDAEAILGRSITAATSAYAVTGTDATPRLGKRMVAEAASYALTGTPATLNRSAGATGTIVFDAAVTDPANHTTGEDYVFALTVAPASGERLVIAGAIAYIDGDFTAVTIDGQAATRVGFVSRGLPDGSLLASANSSFLTAWRAPGTASTSINVAATLTSGYNGSFSGYCACFHMEGVGALYAATNNNLNDPTLSTDTVSSGAVVAALLGYDTGGAASVVWNGLTERFDSITVSGAELFSGASADATTSASPRVITADITPNLADINADSVASIALSFEPAGAASNRTTADTGSYAVNGTNAVARRGFKVFIDTVAYTMNGTPATIASSGYVVADTGAYLLNGSTAALLRSGANKFIDAQAGAYAVTGTDASGRRGKRTFVTSVGAYNMVGTTVTKGVGLIAAAGSYTLLGSIATPVKVSGPNVTISIGGNAMTASVGTASISATTGAGVFVTGNQMAVSVGEETVTTQGGVSFSVTGNQMTADVGNEAVAISGGISITVAGFGLTASMGSPVASIPKSTTVGGNEMIASVGSALVNVIGGTNVAVIGNEMVASVGNVTVGLNANVDVTGNSMTTAVGDESVTTAVSISASGNQATVSVGTATVTAKQNAVVNVTGNAMVAFVGTLAFAGGGSVVLFPTTTREGQMLKQSNWMGG